MRGHCRGAGRDPGPIDVLFAEGDYLEPDLVFVREGREAPVTDRGIEGPPDRRTVDVWRSGAGAEEALVLGAEDVLRWTPVAEAETLELPVERLF